ncbi:MAG: hypothetical protein GF331_07225 [Chitinivibrionales bacterium]|nr:hypothetical protein [Chitinivibrionales bacterium]
MRRWSSLLIVVALVASNARAMSLLSLRYPVGYFYELNSGMSQGMAGPGTAVRSDNNLMLHNPANLGEVRKTVLSTLFTLEFVNILETATDEYTNHVQLIPQHVSFGFSLGRVGALAASFEKRSDADFRWEGPKEVYEEDLNTLRSYEQALVRDGGVSTWAVGWGYPIGKWARLGLAYERSYVSLLESRRLILSGDFTSLSVDTSRVVFSGNGLRAGVIVPVWNLSLGLSGEYFFPASAVYKDWSYVGSPANQTSDSVTSEDFSLRLPPSLSAGVAWQIDPRWLAAVDMDFTFWGEYYSEQVLLSGPLRTTALSFSLGGEFIPSPDELTPAYWETMPFRAGFRFAQLPTTEAFEYGFSLGVGLPFPIGGGLLDVNLEYGRRHDSAYPDYTEEVLRIGFGINGGRKWHKAPQGTY